MCHLSDAHEELYIQQVLCLSYGHCRVSILLRKKTFSKKINQEEEEKEGWRDGCFLGLQKEVRRYTIHHMTKEHCVIHYFIDTTLRRFVRQQD